MVTESSKHVKEIKLANTIFFRLYSMSVTFVKKRSGQCRSYVKPCVNLFAVGGTMSIDEE